MTTNTRAEFRVNGLPTPLSHYTDAVRWGDLLFVSGCVALDEHGRVAAPGDVAGQARVVHECLGRALRAAGADFGHVLKVTVFLTDIAPTGPPSTRCARSTSVMPARPAPWWRSVRWSSTGFWSRSRPWPGYLDDIPAHG